MTRGGCTLNGMRGVRVPGKVPCGGEASASEVAPHGPEKHGGRPCNLESERSRQIVQR